MWKNTSGGTSPRLGFYNTKCTEVCGCRGWGQEGQHVALYDGCGSIWGGLATSCPIPSRRSTILKSSHAGTTCTPRLHSGSALNQTLDNLPAPLPTNRKVLFRKPNAKRHSLDNLPVTPQMDRKVFLQEALSGTTLSGKPSGHPSDGPEGFFAGSPKRNCTFRSTHPLGLYNIKGGDWKPESTPLWVVHGPSNNVPGPRGLTEL